MYFGPVWFRQEYLLRCINGLETFQQGTISIANTPGLSDKQSVREREAALRVIRRSVGMVFQQFHFVPHLSAIENVMEVPRSAPHEQRSARERYPKSC